LIVPSKIEHLPDDELIEMTARVTREIRQPRKHPLNPVPRPERWWEGKCIIPRATMYDLEEKLFLNAGAEGLAGSGQR